MKKWYAYIPHPLLMIFGIIILASILTHVIPGGAYDRTMVEGKAKVVAGSFHYIKALPVSLLQMFFALPQGFKTAVDIIFVILSSGIMFGFLQASGAIENGIGTFVKVFGEKNKFLVVVIMTFLYGCLGVFMGFENNIAMIPIASLLSLALGGDLVLAAGMAVGGVTIGFGLSPFNPYTVGTAHKIAQLPMFSGAILRGVLCLGGLAVLSFYNVRYLKKIGHNPKLSLDLNSDKSGLSLSKPIASYGLSLKDKLVLGLFLIMIGGMLYGVFKLNWYLPEMAGLFCMFACVLAFFLNKNGDEIGELVLSSVAVVAPGAFLVGFASTIKVILEQSLINDTIAHHLSQILIGLPTYLSAIGMFGTQCLMNFVIPSGSGQALATLPVLLPVGEVLGLTKQTTVLAFQTADGISNLLNPAMGGLIAMIAICRVPFDKWVRFIAPVAAVLTIMALLSLLFAVAIQYGPF
jgi:uncharacterized ion transporter superfamily protein YfcC